ncbi:unnamed protein product [Microthlaspi erraticum]|uniref:RNase H type-1 domain-containing protein n=1 Tax=Microthlaspi erraticum TaxID=1685480 RepID=A0A6D2KE18_9BRAS|nr:unnamed protein product [Microthlaspi erraticum]
MILPKIDDPKPSGKPLPNKTSGNFGITPQRLYRLYFKGLVREHSLAGFGVAICDQYDKLLFQMKGPIHSPNVTVLESELTALQRGLTEAATLRINHLSIYFDYQPLYKLGVTIQVRNEDVAHSEWGEL